MAKMPLSKLQPGMKLSNPVLDSFGNPILNADTELTEKHIRLMKTWGIESIDIVSSELHIQDPTAEREADAAHLETYRSELLPIFRKANMDHPAMKELLRLAVLVGAEKDKGGRA